MISEPIIEHKPEDSVCAIRLISEGKRISGLWVHDLKARVGSTIVRMGGIGGVHTEEAYRKRGFARRVMEDSTEYMRDDGYDIAALFGIRNFYEKWGYIPALPEYRITVRANEITNARLQHRVVDYAPQHNSAILGMYNDNNRTRSCTIARRSEAWDGFSKGASFGLDAAVKVLLNNFVSIAKPPSDLPRTSPGPS